MLFPILAVLALTAVQSSLAGALDYGSAPDLSKSLQSALGPRDTPPEATVYGERCRRAFANHLETLPAFLTLALLHQLQSVTGDLDSTAVMAAWAYFGLRVAYVPAYLSGVMGVRSAVWMSATGALIGMAALLVLG